MKKREKNVSLTKWDSRFIGLAEHIAGWSKDDSTRVGAVIVDSKNRVVSVGYNGPPVGVKDHYTTRDEKLFKTIHAEVNAALFANRSIEGCTVYVTHACCANCAAVLVQKGIARVVFPPPSQGFRERWKESYYTALQLFGEAGIRVDEVKA
jgi:dCMP deaminase